jgi:hypothetical protein
MNMDRRLALSAGGNVVDAAARIRSVAEERLVVTLRRELWDGEH